MRRRIAELGGLALGLIGLAILVALASYDPRDPSLNTATARQASNLAGPAGAVLADMLLQGFGFAAGLPGVAMLAWAWRVASRRGLGSFAARIAAAAGALPVLAARPEPATASSSAFARWPTWAGPGGAVGRALSQITLDAGRGVMGPFGVALVSVLGVVLALVLTLLAIGLSAGEWRIAGRAATWVGGFAFAKAHGLLRVMPRIGMALIEPFLFVGRLLRRRREHSVNSTAALSRTAEAPSEPRVRVPRPPKPALAEAPADLPPARSKPPSAARRTAPAPAGEPAAG